MQTNLAPNHWDHDCPKLGGGILVPNGLPCGECGEEQGIRALLVEAHKALSFATLLDPKLQRDFLKLDAAMAELGFFPHRSRK